MRSLSISAARFLTHLASQHAVYGFFFAYPIVFAAGHGFSYGQTGLTFVRPLSIPLTPRSFLAPTLPDSPLISHTQFGILIGIGLVAITACPLQENYYQRKVIEGNGSTPPETRLPLMMGCALILPCSLFIFAWTSPPEVSWVGPCVSGIPFGRVLPLSTLRPLELMRNTQIFARGNLYLGQLVPHRCLRLLRRQCQYVLLSSHSSLH